MTPKELKDILKENNLTPEQFAKSLYVSIRTVYNWLSGRKIPREKVRHIIDVYGKRNG